MTDHKRSYERVTFDEVVATVMQRVPEAQRQETELLIESLVGRWEPQRERYEMARWLARGLLWTFVFIIALSSALMLSLLILSASSSNIGAEQIDLVTSFVKDLLPFVATPLGVVIGFYFREAQSGVAG